MKTVISISEARKQLPGIIKKLRQSPDTVYQVTVHNEVVAEIRTSPQAKPGEAAKQLLALKWQSSTLLVKVEPRSQGETESLA